jgi:hypothetical protein
MRIEFVRPEPPSRALRIAALAALALCVAALLAAVLAHRRLEGDQRDWRSAQEERRIAADAATASSLAPRTSAVPVVVAATLRMALRRASLPEGAALRTLERVAVRGIQIESIALDGAAETVTVELHSSGDAALMDYLAQLDEGEDVRHWRLERVALAAGTAPTTAGGSIARPAAAGPQDDPAESRLARLVWKAGAPQDASRER